MYAVVKTGGKQLKVEVGETVSVELLAADAGAVVTLPALLINDGEKVLTGEDAAKATVTAEVVGHGKADKVVIFKLKKRKGYKRTRGHRQPLTLIKVTDIALPGAKPAKAAKPAAVTVAEKPTAKAPAAKKAAAKPAAAKKPVAKKAEAAEKPAAAKKPVAKKAKAAEKPAAAKKPAVKKPAVKKTTKPTESAE
jgi:large subunit ribosomal protein L21